jgi:hypothetical protein
LNDPGDPKYGRPNGKQKYPATTPENVMDATDFHTQTPKSHTAFPAQALKLMRAIFLTIALMTLLLMAGGGGGGFAQDGPTPERYPLPNAHGNPCTVILAQVVKNVSYNGGCVDGLADGWGELDIFQDPFGRLQHQGYFRQGYPLKNGYLSGVFMHAADQQLYFYTPQDFGDLFLPATANGLFDWDLCAAPAALFPNPAIPDAQTRARAYYTRLCPKAQRAFITPQKPPYVPASINTTNRLPSVLRAVQR